MLNPDSFNGKLLLLLIDKLVIGAIVALALLAYDRYKTIDSRKYEKERADTQLSFERSRLIKEFLPVIQDANIDLTTRAYVLRSAVLTESIDSDAAFELGQDFLRKGLEMNHFTRLVSTMLPRGIAAFSRRGVQIGEEWFRSFKDAPDLDMIFNPVSSQEHLPEKEAGMITEARLLRDVLYERLSSFDSCVCPELTDEAEIPAHLSGYTSCCELRIGKRPRRPRTVRQN